MTRSPLPEAAAEVAALRRRIAESAPRRGWRPPDDAAVRFATLPLSARTLAGRSDLLFRRHSSTGAVQCLTNKSAIELNEMLHANN